MVTRFLLLLSLASALSGCSLYPFGHSKFGPYFGGMGPGPDPMNYVPPQVANPRP